MSKVSLDLVLYQDVFESYVNDWKPVHRLEDLAKFMLIGKNAFKIVLEMFKSVKTVVFANNCVFFKFPTFFVCVPVKEVTSLLKMLLKFAAFDAKLIVGENRMNSEFVPIYVCFLECLVKTKKQDLICLCQPPMIPTVCELLKKLGKNGFRILLCLDEPEEKLQLLQDCQLQVLFFHKITNNFLNILERYPFSCNCFVSKLDDLFDENFAVKLKKIMPKCEILSLELTESSSNLERISSLKKIVEEAPQSNFELVLNVVHDSSLEVWRKNEIKKILNGQKIGQNCLAWKSTRIGFPNKSKEFQVNFVEKDLPAVSNFEKKPVAKKQSSTFCNLN